MTLNTDIKVLPGCLVLALRIISHVLVVDRIQFLAVVGPKSLFPCWPSARDPSQVPEAILISCHVAPSISKTSNGESPPCKILLKLQISLTDMSLTSRSDLNGSYD